MQACHHLLVVVKTYNISTVTLQDVAASASSRQQSSSCSEPSVAPPSIPHPATGPTPASQFTSTHPPNDSQTSNASTLPADGSQTSLFDQVHSDRGRSPAAADASEASTSALQGDSPKTRWSQVAASSDAAQPAGRPRGSSPSSMTGTAPGRAMHAPSNGSASSTATQDHHEYARTDSAGSLSRDPGVSERRASGAAAGMPAFLSCRLVQDACIWAQMPGM